MAGTTDVKALMLQVDASVELLRRNLQQGIRDISSFEQDAARRVGQVDQRLGRVGDSLNVGPSVARTRAQLATVGATADRVEQQVRRSSAGIRTALLSSAAAIGTAFSAQQVKEYADSYTRFTNQLRVAGREGQSLTDTQQQLFQIAQRNGTELEALGTLYGRASTSARDLGASNADIIKFTSGVSAALRVQGGTTEAASGALQQLGQLLGSARVQAEEFNSVQDGARPILQAVADNIDEAGGSISRLKALVTDGKVSNVDFFNAFLKGSAALEAQAAKTSLTIGASFTILNNAIGKYIGESDASLSATARVAGAITSIADNLNIIVPALGAIGIAFAINRVAATRFVTDFVAGTYGAGAATRVFAQQITEGNVAMIGTVAAAAARAEALAAGAATEVASIESTIATRRAEQIVLNEQIAAERALIVERRLAAQAAAVSLTQGGLNSRTASLAAQRKAENDATFATQRLTIARERLAIVDAELSVAEGSLAGAQTRSAVAADVAAAANARATLAARAGAAASKLFAGALTLIGGSVAGGAAVLAIGALVGAVLLYRSAITSAEERNRAAAASMEEAAKASKRLNLGLADLATLSASAASGVARTGAAAASSTGQMLTFAGAVGEAAEKLRGLAVERRRAQVLDFAKESVEAERRANAAQARINARTGNIAAASGGTAMGVSGGGINAADRRANAQDAQAVAYWRSIQSANFRAAQQAANIPLANRIRESDRAGGRDIDGDLARVTRDLVVARERGIRSQVDALEAQKFELTQYKKYRKDGLSPQAASDAASADRTAFTGASAGAQGDRDARTGRTARSKADREAAAAARRQAAEVRDAAADTRAFAAGERQANNDIAAARADLTNSMVERAAIEKARIEAERQSRNEELAEQAKQGRFGEGDTGQQRLKALQRLNDQRAALETQVVDARERQRVADEALALASADRTNQADLLRAQSNLVTSAGERRDLERRILAIQYDEERARLDGVIASRETTEAEKEIARRRRAMLGELQSRDEQNVDQQNAGPLDQYRQRLRVATSDMKEALQGVAVQGFDAVENSLLSMIEGTESAGDAFKKMARVILAELARIAIQKAVISTIGGGFLGFSGGGDLKGYAGGGSPGGLIQGPGTGTSDSILAVLGGRSPIRVSTDEFIMNAAATREWLPELYAMNSGRAKKFATGGALAGVPRFAAGGSLRTRGAPRLTAPALPNIDGMAAGRGRDRIDVQGEIKVSPTKEFDARMEGLAFRTTAAAAEPIMAGAEMRTLSRMQRPKLPGGQTG